MVKDEGLKISKVEEVPGAYGEFHVYLERPYYNGNRLNTDIIENTFVNLHTVKSISFTKGLVLKKHLIMKEPVATKQGNGSGDEDADDQGDGEGGLLDGDPEKIEKKRKRERLYLEYLIHFTSTNIMNLEKLAMGGAEYKEIEWWIEMEGLRTRTKSSGI